MRKKVVFFDIDGTLWNEKNEIPQSTVEAVKALQENGHLAFLCSGRGRAYIQDPRLLGIGFDGIVSGCGTMIEYRNEVVFYKQLEAGLVEHTIRTVRRYGCRPILEGREYLYMDDEEFADDYFGRKLRAEMGEKLLPIAGNWGKWEISKLSCATEGADTESCFKALQEFYEYLVHNPAVVEIVPKGYGKGTAIGTVCELVGADRMDTFAFGDSVNDLSMLRAAGVGIAMGNGTKEVKSEADYVTDSLMENGIWNACRRFGLIA